jgi:ABC-type Zn uptake system ZnuABC Zn-binding protein ZnuA
MVCSKLSAVLRALLLLPLLAAVLAGCGDDSASGDAPLRVVATTGQAADFARQVGGDRVQVTGLLAPNADPHEYEMRPDDVKALADADVLVRSGGDLDDWLDGAIESAGNDAPVLTLADHVEVVDGDPHWWQDPHNAIAATAAVRDALAAADPDGARAYRRNAAAYEAELRALDRRVRACLAKVPAAQRTLVTTHDALGYYARRYGIRVVGAVIPSRSTVAQPSAGDVTALVDTIRREGVRAVFAESSVNADVEAAIARDAGAKVGRALWADTLGPENSDGATYVDSIASNTAALVDGFSGGKVACRP